tara:strand:+ start:846 stop:1841 length:996 start_codon:yes stop_codon:yes gene_type:complete
VPNTESSIDLAQIFEPIHADLQAVEQEYARQVESRVELIPQIGKYIQRSGGKRIRPALLLMASRLAAYRGDQAVLFASVVEFIHTATLVHDDIVDDSQVRRGQEAVHLRWGNEKTVLLGDYLYIKSMGMALSHDSLDVVRLLCEVTLRMIEGELYQLTKNGDVDITEEQHFDIIRRKTAYLFGGCAEIGGRLGQVPEDQAEALREYGFNLGVAFQVIDDLLDYTATESELGKPIGSDLREGKVTLPVIYLLQRDGKTASDLVRHIVETGAATSDEWRELSLLIAQHRVIDSAYEKARESAEAAQRHLKLFPPSPEREALLALPDYVLARER